MSLNKYQACDETHFNDFQYVCLRDKKVFCLKCWYQKEHYRSCISTRCGKYSKIAHLAINRAMEYKNFKLLESMSSSSSSFQNHRVNFLQINFQITELIKQYIEQKVPLLIWSLANDILGSKAGIEQISTANKFDSHCSEMIQLIKSGDKNKKHENLETAIGTFYQINHQIEGEVFKYKQGFSFNNYQNNREQKVNQITDNIKSNLGNFVRDVTTGIRKTIDTELQKLSLTIDGQTKFKGVVFQKVTTDNQHFRKRQQYPFINILSQNYAKITNEQNELYNGFYVNLSDLQNNSEELLQTCKCMIKQKLFTVHQSITSIKSSFPYKYSYIISTTITNDQTYEELLLEMERIAITISDKSNTFLSTITIVIMGRQVIVIRFDNYPKFCYTKKIYNYRPERNEFYDKLQKKFQINNIPRKNLVNNHIIFNESMTDTSLVYCNFRIAYQEIFLSNNQQELIFEGQKIMAARGAQQFSDLLNKWRNTAQIELNFSVSQKQMIKSFI